MEPISNERLDELIQQFSEWRDSFEATDADKDVVEALLELRQRRQEKA